MFKSVLIPLDGSEQAARAIVHGINIAEHDGASVLLLRVLPAESQAELGGNDATGLEPDAKGLRKRDYLALRAQAQGYLDSIKHSLRGRSVPVNTRVETGEPAVVITDVARSLEVPVVVITPHGKSAGINRPPKSTLGAVAGEVIRRCSSPVLVV
jgi:nucleotide-binding universal stress UspA family protein